MVSGVTSRLRKLSDALVVGAIARTTACTLETSGTSTHQVAVGRQRPKAGVEVLHQLGTCGGVDDRLGGGQVLGHFGGALGVAGAESVGVRSFGGEPQSTLATEVVQVTDSQLQDVSLLEFRDVLPFGLQGSHHQLLELVQAPVDSGTTFALKHRLHHLDKTKNEFGEFLGRSGDPSPNVNKKELFDFDEVRGGNERRLPCDIGRCERWAGLRIQAQA